MKTNFITHTSGDGFWSDAERAITIVEVYLNYTNRDEDDGHMWGELHARFRRKDWNPDKLGLIYTDTVWLKTFKLGLAALGASRKVAADPHYSEQGMQGPNYVSMDVGDTFLRSRSKFVKQLLEEAAEYRVT